VWYGGPRQVRLAAPVPMGETDFVRNGSTAWLWQSSGSSATRFLLPRRASAGPGPVPPRLPLTPERAARQILAAVGPTTRVTTQSNVTVAGQAAYQLVIVPRDSRSLVGQVTIALDGQHLAVPLRVQVFARGANAPAFQVGYTSISFVRPAAANFAFTPPRGAHVHTVRPALQFPSAMLPPGPGTRTFVPLPRGTRLRHAVLVRPGKQAHRVIRLRPARIRRGWSAYAPLSSKWYPGKAAGLLPGALAPAAGAPRVIGKAWLSVAVLPASALSGLANGNAVGAAGQAARSVSGQGGSVNSAAVLAVLLKSARPVHGTWGSGQLLRTSLVSMLITRTGHVLIGAVTPQVLYAAAAHAK
jgi:hypothetical protein